jgi:hypothetical protein
VGELLGIIAGTLVDLLATGLMGLGMSPGTVPYRIVLGQKDPKRSSEVLVSFAFWGILLLGWYGLARR